MPEIGEIKRAGELGRKGHHLLIYHACLVCGKERWVSYRKGKAVSKKCVACGTGLGNKKHTRNWRGGRITNKNGYILIRLRPDDFFYSMTSNSYVFEHRLVVAKALNRCLLPWEIVHHKGKMFPSGSKENRSDNRYPENLQLLEDKKYHLIDSLVKTHIKRQDDLIKELQTRVTLLEAELVAVRIFNKPFITVNTK